MSEQEKWTVLKRAAILGGYAVEDDGKVVTLIKKGTRLPFSKQETGHITGYMQACIFLARQGIKPRHD